MAGQYIGVGGVARKVKAQHIGVGGVARKATGGWVGVNGVARRFLGHSPVEVNVSKGANYELTGDWDNYVSFPVSRVEGTVTINNFRIDTGEDWSIVGSQDISIPITSIGSHRYEISNYAWSVGSVRINKVYLDMEFTANWFYGEFTVETSKGTFIIPCGDNVVDSGWSVQFTVYPE